jgi:hypothetical protein
MRTVLTKLACPTVAIFLLSSLLASSAGAGLLQAQGRPTSNASSILEPASGALLGLFYGAGSVAETSKKLGRMLPVHLTYYAWDADWNGSVTKADLAAGRIPLVNWEPHHIDFHKIVNGSLDATIAARANGAKALGQRFFLDFAAEMNSDEAWGGNNPTLYVAAYRHIHDIFTAAGATNVVWVWCPNVTDTDGSNRTTMDYYPGDSYVDWTGVDGYNWGTKNGGWQSFQKVFRNIYPLLARRRSQLSSARCHRPKLAEIKAVGSTRSFPRCAAAFLLSNALSGLTSTRKPIGASVRPEVRKRPSLGWRRTLCLIRRS